MWPDIISAGVALVALLAEHIWVQNRVSSLERRTQFVNEVEHAIEQFEKQISDLIVDLEDWGLKRGSQDASSLRHQWIKISRDLNRLTVKLAKGSPFQPSLGWGSIDTEESDETMQNLNDGFRAITSQSAMQALERLATTISTCLNDSRPN